MFRCVVRCGNDVCLQPDFCVDEVCVKTPPGPWCGKRHCLPTEACVDMRCVPGGEECGETRCSPSEMCVEGRCRGGGVICGKERCLMTQICVNSRCQCREGETFSPLHQLCGLDCFGQACFRPKQCYRGQRPGMETNKFNCLLWGKFLITVVAGFNETLGTKPIIR